jgi:hypothetical protein
MGRGFKIPWIEGQNTMGRGSKYHGYGVRYTMDKGFNIPWVGGSAHSGQVKEYKLGICISTKQAALKSKNKDWLAALKNKNTDWLAALKSKNKDWLAALKSKNKDWYQGFKIPYDTGMSNLNYSQKVTILHIFNLSKIMF